MNEAIICAALLVSISTFACCQEGDPTGPNFTGHYVLIRATGALRGRAPEQLHILQTERWFRVGTVDDHGGVKWTKVPLRTDWVADDGRGKVKAYFARSPVAPNTRASDCPEHQCRIHGTDQISCAPATAFTVRHCLAIPTALERRAPARRVKF